MAKFMLLTTYDGGACEQPMLEWDPADIKAHLDFLKAIQQEVSDRGELVEATALTWPEAAKRVTSDGAGAPVLTDGPFAEVKEMLAGYVTVDVDSEERAIEIAAKISSAPASGGVPMQQPIEVRQVMGTPGGDL